LKKKLLRKKKKYSHCRSSIFYYFSKCFNHLIRTLLVEKSTKNTERSLHEILKKVNPVSFRKQNSQKSKSASASKPIPIPTEYDKQYPSFILSENDLSDPLMGNPSAPPSAPPEYLDDHLCKIKKNPLFDISDFNCINHDPEHGCAGFVKNRNRTAEAGRDSNLFEGFDRNCKWSC